MGLLSFFQRQTDAAAQPPLAEPDAGAAARVRARRRLIGAAVLLGIGVVGFPLLFESQPRPVPVNIPIEIPSKDQAAPLAPPGPGPALAAASAATVLPDAELPNARAAGKPGDITERAADAGREVVAATPTPAQSPTPAVRGAVAAVAKPPAAASRPASPAQSAATAVTTPSDSARARALLNGDAASAAAVGRMVVQVGAYTEPAKLKDARQKVEKLGFKTYTQVVEVDGAKRTRVRIGPFATRAEADKAAARIKASGLPVAVLAL